MEGRDQLDGIPQVEKVTEVDLVIGALTVVLEIKVQKVNKII